MSDEKPVYKPGEFIRLEGGTLDIGVWGPTAEEAARRLAEYFQAGDSDDEDTP